MLINPNGYYFLRQPLVWKGFSYAEAGCIVPVTSTPSAPEMVTLGSKGMFPTAAFLLAEPLEVESADPFKKPGVYVDSQGHTLWSSSDPTKAEELGYGPLSFLYIVPGGSRDEGAAAWTLVFTGMDGIYRSTYLRPLDRPTYRVKDSVYARYGSHLVDNFERWERMTNKRLQLEKEVGELSEALNQAKLDLSRREAPPPPQPPLTGDPTADRLFIAAVLQEGTWDKHRNQYGLDRDMLLRWAEDAVTREDVEDELKGYFLREIETARKSLAYFPDLSTVEEKCAYKRRPVYAVELTPISPEAVDKALEGVKPEDLPQPVETAPAESIPGLATQALVPPAALIALMTAEPAQAPVKAPAKVTEKVELPEWLVNFGEALTSTVTQYRALGGNQAEFLRPARGSGLVKLFWAAAAPPGTKLPSLCSAGLANMIEAAISKGVGAPIPAWPLQGLVDGSYFRSIPTGVGVDEIAAIDAVIADLAKRGHSL